MNINPNGKGRIQIGSRWHQAMPSYDFPENMDPNDRAAVEKIHAKYKQNTGTNAGTINPLLHELFQQFPQFKEKYATRIAKEPAVGTKLLIRDMEASGIPHTQWPAHFFDYLKQLNLRLIIPKMGEIANSDNMVSVKGKRRDSMEQQYEIGTVASVVHVGTILPDGSKEKAYIEMFIG